ncbi:hypothetical protein B0T25DRAFT_290014 [Lasiosphaeria hispida]|uniref:RGS domain-containing protein n=1 Tax=Lasiosphaeria hispida TaxID=260671 RepID=A0AAJ0MB43_9PEZI|nr:hypothetical protein B0T25DRAFT_290014 [Lasiosphaeria hispida]
MRFPSWLTWYKKPEYRDFREYANNISAGKRSLSPDGRKNAIPSRLRLERILANKTCSPMSLYDFYMYLKYIEFSAENLEFYMWFKNYETAYAKGLAVVEEKRYGSFDSGSESTSSVASIKNNVITTVHEEDGEDQDPEVTKETLARISQLISADALCSSKGRCAPAIMDPKNFEANASSMSAMMRPVLLGKSELDTIIHMFLIPGAEKELNIPPSLRRRALADLQTSSHPQALKPVADHVYGLLRNCSHRNFVRLGVGNGTFETVCVATMLGFVCTVAGFLVVMTRGFTPYRGAHTRWETFAAWPLWWLGLSLILSGLRGSCFFLLLFSRRQRLPWERFDDSESVLSNKNGLIKALSRLMIFDRRLSVKDAHLRRLQRKIVFQSLFGGAVFATVGVLLFIFLPMWRETI